MLPSRHPKVLNGDCTFDRRMLSDHSYVDVLYKLPEKLRIDRNGFEHIWSLKPASFGEVLGWLDVHT